MSTLTPGDGQDLLAAYKRACERRDPEASLVLYATDAEHRANPFDDAVVGANAIRQMWNDVAAGQANVEFDAEHLWVVGSTVLTSFHGAYTDRETTERVRIRGFMTIEVNDDGLIQRLRQWPASRVVGVDSTFKVDAGRREGSSGR